MMDGISAKITAKGRDYYVGVDFGGRDRSSAVVVLCEDDGRGGFRVLAVEEVPLPVSKENR